MKHKNITKKIVSYMMGVGPDELSKITRNRISEKFNINNSYLSKKFKEDTNMSFSEFLDLEKLNRARMMLKERNDLTIKDISKEIGIEKCEQFRRKFKKYFYLKPSQYRELFKKR